MPEWKRCMLLRQLTDEVVEDGLEEADPLEERWRDREDTQPLRKELRLRLEGAIDDFLYDEMDNVTLPWRDL